MKSEPVQIIAARSAQHFADATVLIREYANWLNFDLSFQNFDDEMSSLPDMYNSNDGGLFLAYLKDQPVGVVGLRRFSKSEGEVKRMFVKESARGHGVGKLLLATCIETARVLCYKSLKLDTTDSMTAAIRLYVDHGFVEIASYRFNPQPGARYFGLELAQ